MKVAHKILKDDPRQSEIVKHLTILAQILHKYVISHAENIKVAGKIWKMTLAGKKIVKHLTIFYSHQTSSR